MRAVALKSRAPSMREKSSDEKSERFRDGCSRRGPINDHRCSNFILIQPEPR